MSPSVGVAQVADVRGLVRVDRRVFDDDLSSTGGAARAAARSVAPAGRRRAIEEEVQIAVRRGLHAGDACDCPESGGELLRDGAWRLPQASGQFERDRDGQVAERASGGVSITIAG